MPNEDGMESIKIIGIKSFQNLEITILLFTYWGKTNNL